MLIRMTIALAGALIMGAAGVTRASAAVQPFSVAQASTGLGAAGRTGSNPFSAQQPSLGSPSGANPNNAQDMKNRGNRQDMTVPRARNPQDLSR